MTKAPLQKCKPKKRKMVKKLLYVKIHTVQANKGMKYEILTNGKCQCNSTISAPVKWK